MISEKHPVVSGPYLPESFEEIPAEALTPPARAQAIIDKVQEKPEIKYLARSIVLMWYLGAWYDPDNLRALAELPPPTPSEGVGVRRHFAEGLHASLGVTRSPGSPEMGFSDPVGYWTHAGQPVDSFIGTKFLLRSPRAVAANPHRM